MPVLEEPPKIKAEVTISKPTPPELPVKETPRDKFERLHKKISGDVELVDSGALKDSEQDMKITPTESGEIVKTQAPKAQEYARNYAARRHNSKLRGAADTIKMTTQEIAEYERLEKIKDQDTLFEKWFTNQHLDDEKPPSRTAKTLARAQWKLMGQKNRMAVIAQEKQMYERLWAENQATLAPIDQQLAYPPEEKVGMLVHQRQAEISVQEAMERTNMPPADLKELAERRKQTEADILKAKEAYKQMLSHPALPKEVGIHIAEAEGAEFRSSNESKLEPAAKGNIQEQITIINTNLSEAQAALKDMTQAVEISVIKGYVREIGELVKELEALTPELQKQMGNQLIDGVATLATKLGMDETDIRLLFKRGRNGVVTGVYNGTLGEVAQVLAQQVEDGIDLKGGQGIVTADSLEKLNPELAIQLNTTLIGQEQLAQAVTANTDKLKINDKKEIDISGAKKLYLHYAKDGILPEGIDIRLVNHREPPRIVLTQKISDSLTATHVLTEAIEGDWTKINSGVQFDNPVIAEPGKVGETASWFRVEHLILNDTVTKQNFDVRSIISSKCDFRYKPNQTTEGMSAEFGEYSRLSSEKNIQYTDLSSAERILALFHEVGHNIHTAHLDSKFAGEGQHRLEKINSLVAQNKATDKTLLTKEEYIKTKRFMVINERGASARALFIAKELKKRGIRSGLANQQMTDYVETALVSYEKGLPQLYPECGRPFIREDKFNRVEEKRVVL